MKEILSRFLPFLFAFLFMILLVAMSGSGLIAKKVIGHLVLPAGFLWLVGFTAMCWPGVKRPVRGVLIGVWLLYSFTGSPYAGVALLRFLEEPYYRLEQPAEKLDALVLLGGGTGLSPGGQPALGTHGAFLTS